MAITDDGTAGRLEPGRAGIRGEILPPERISRLILDLRAAVRDRSLRTWVTAAERLVPSCAAVLWLHPRPLTSAEDSGARTVSSSLRYFAESGASTGELRRFAGGVGAEFLRGEDPASEVGLGDAELR